mgnify:FL=1|tara:strand:- start:535 stop:699 length:165 start_codon:yes stop_codon:yes gene_type:complete
MYFKDFTTSSNNFEKDFIDVLDFIENEYVYEEEVLKANKDLEVEIQELQLDNLD